MIIKGHQKQNQREQCTSIGVHQENTSIQDLIKEKLHVMFYTEKIPQTFAGVVDASPGLTFLLVETLRFLPFWNKNKHQISAFTLTVNGYLMLQYVNI